MTVKATHDHRKKILLKVWLPILIVIIIVAGGIAVWFFVALPHSEKEQQIRQQKEVAAQLYDEHQKCIKKLDQDFKTLDSSNQDAYQKAYDDCEEIRKKQNHAVDEYARLMNES